jgi:hypothetical protein
MASVSSRRPEAGRCTAVMAYAVRTGQCQASSLPDESGSQRSGGLRNAGAD